MGSGAARRPREGWAARPIDPTDDEQYASWFAVVEAAHEPLWPGAPGWQAPELRACMVLEEAPERSLPLAVPDADGVVVGAACVDLARFDTPHLAMIWVYVDPGARRLGVGTVLVAACERLARSEGRSVVAGWQDEPVSRRGRSGGRSFAQHLGYDMVQSLPRRELTVPIDPAVREALGAECARHSTGYHVETFSGPWPDHWLAERAEFGYRMSVDTPRGGFARDDEVWDEARVRLVEAVIDASDRLHLCAAVVHDATGRLAGFSEIAVPRSAPSVAYQHDTLILREHRGHRLGTLVKLANLEALAVASPETRVVVTHNASDNDRMIAVNDSLGCVVVADGLTWQKRVG